MVKKLWKFLLILLAIAVVFLICFFGFFTIMEYRPKQKENVKVQSGNKALKRGEAFKIVTWNIGYSGLDKDEDFFMDGGKSVFPKSKEQVLKNEKAIGDFLKDEKADIYFLQEVDKSSKRSFYTNQVEKYEKDLGIKGMYARNFKCVFVPFPMPPLGKIDSGVLTFSEFKADSATRIALPESFTWPMKTCNLKRCMLETRLPIEGSDKELVLINFHLEAYDSGNGKKAQSAILKQKLEEEYKKGNYVIAGGDFNQTFNDILEKYPIKDKDGWTPLVQDKSYLPKHFSFEIDDTYATCRSLEHKYTGSYDSTQVFVIDGFIVSDNIEVKNLSVINKDFQNSDHNPVKAELALK